MRRISATRARAILGAAHNGRTDEQLESVLNMFYGLAAIAIDAHQSQPGRPVTNVTSSSESAASEFATPEQEEAADWADALVAAGLPPSEAARLAIEHRRDLRGD